MALVHLENARSEDQKKIMEEIIEDGVCPFCIENLHKYHKNPILKEGKHWIITRNQWPYKGTKNHLLAIAKQHVVKFDELLPEAGQELFSFFQEIWSEQEINGGTIAMRVGNDGNYASSVKHLHVHLIEPDFESPEHEGIQFKVSKKR